MATQKSLNNTLLGNTQTPMLTPGKATGKSILEKLKSLSQKAATTASAASEGALDELHMATTPETLGESSSSPLLMLRYVFAFLIVAFILLNILGSLGLLPNVLEDFFKPILLFFGHSVGETVKQTAEVSAKGAEAVVDLPVHALGGAVDILHEKVNPDQKAKALNHPDKDPTQKEEPQPDDASSRTQAYRGSGKSGYCYIGEDRGFRSCIEVQNDDECMSGKIFPTRDICINPSLRQ